MRERPSSRGRQSQSAVDIPFQQKDCNTGPMSSRDSSPMLQVRLPCDALSDDNSSLHTMAILWRLQALTLSTNLSKTEKPRTKMSVGGTLQEAEQYFRAKTLQTIKASHLSLIHI